MIHIERINFDTYNHPKNNCNFIKDANDLTINDLDYDTEIARTNLLNYADLIQYPFDHSYQFTKNEIDVLLGTMKTGIAVGRLSHLIEDDLEPIIDRMARSWINGKWFVRFNSCSPKDGNAKYPITSARQLIEMIVTSSRSRGALNHGDDTLYFVKYDTNWDSSRELRVFIHGQQITAITQYSPYELSYYSDKTDSELTNFVLGIKKYLNDIIPIICKRIGTNDLVCDLYLNDDGTFKIIEFNSFGYWLASGSVLFHWLNDYHVLYNRTNDVYLRVLVSELKN